MARAVAALCAQLIVATTIFALNVFFISLAGFLRLLPTLVPVLWRGTWGLLVLSCRLYYLVLTRLAPYIQAWTHVQVLEGLWRLTATVLLSLLLGLVFLLLLQWPVSGWALLLTLLHGIFVDLVWDEIPDSGGLQLGVKIQ